ncbi:barstar family protein [Streptomyces sp. NPDC127584]|uniref:barstar family protein n=1 Tax=Streptomyces sp. NPDC127584 TaxID=3345403 RepID=UPI003627D5B6
MDIAAFDVAKPEAPWVIFGPSEAVEFNEQTAALHAAGGRVYEVHARDLTDEAGVLDAFAQAVGVPSCFGWNWDALVDCLDDLHETATGGVGIVVVIQGADALLWADHLKVFMRVLCLAADRANTDRARADPVRLLGPVPHLDRRHAQRPPTPSGGWKRLNTSASIRARKTDATKPSTASKRLCPNP